MMIRRKAAAVSLWTLLIIFILSLSAWLQSNPGGITTTTSSSSSSSITSTSTSSSNSSSSVSTTTSTSGSGGGYSITVNSNDLNGTKLTGMLVDIRNNGN